MSKAGKSSPEIPPDPWQKFSPVEDGSHVASPFLPWRVFVNQVDSYHGKKLAEFFSDQFYNTKKTDDDDTISVGEGEEEENEKEEEEEEEDNGEPEGARGSLDLGMDEDINEEVDTATKRKMQPGRKYEVVGTVAYEEHPLPEDVSMIISPDRNGDSFLNELMKCGVIVYDITQDFSQIAEADWAVEAVAEELRKRSSEAPKAFKRSGEVRHFVLISTVMTWTLSKPLYSAEDPDLAFTEMDYRKRKPHPNFAEHSRCEKNVATILKRFPELKKNLKTIVLCCGVTYGDEEGTFHYIFKMAWLNTPELPIFGTGKNKIPLLHVRNIPKILLMLLRDWPKLRYIVAVEHVRMSQKTIVKGISRTLGTGKTRIVALEEAFLTSDVSQKSYDMATLNLNIEPAYIADEKIEWHSEFPFSMNLGNIVKEYKTARNLHPVKILVLGPPASGKSRLAKSLAQHYKVHYINIESLITETINKLTAEIEAAKGAQNPGDDEDNDDDEEEKLYKEVEEEVYGVEIWENELKEISKNLSENNERLDDEVLTKILWKKLSSNECQNQGYVLDGYPKTLSQAKQLFGDDRTVDDEKEKEKEEEVDLEEDDEDDVAAVGFNRNILPELVVVLEGSDDFLTERLLRLSEAEIRGTHYTEEHMLRRFREYRDRNTEEESPAQFFDELEIHPVFISLEEDPCPEMFSTLNICLNKIGKPRNYGPTPEEAIEIRHRRDAEAKAAERAEEERKAVEELNRKSQRERKMMEWTNLLEKLKEEEENQLCIMGEPLRHYLVKYVFPTLTQGLVNVAELRPEDPVDYLAEYLFKENPDGKMFEPDYTETMSALLSTIEEFQKDILPFEELDEGTEKYLNQTRESSVKLEGDTEETLVDCPYQKRSSNSGNSEVYDPETGMASSFEGEMN